jgi:hypothetical protein
MMKMRMMNVINERMKRTMKLINEMKISTMMNPLVTINAFAELCGTS